MKKACLYTVIIDNWNPELCSITVPLMRAWAKMMGADFKIIDTIKFPGWPPNYERFQVHELGREYFWNIVMDADFVFDPEKLSDPIQSWRDPRMVYFATEMSASYYFKDHPWFQRDKRYVGVADPAIMASYLTHDFWMPLEMSYDEAASYCKKNSRQVSELTFSLNLARYGLQWDGIFNGVDPVHHISVTGEKHENSVDLAIAKLNEMNVDYKRYQKFLPY